MAVRDTLPTYLPKGLQSRCIASNSSTSKRTAGVLIFGSEHHGMCQPASVIPVHTSFDIWMPGMKIAIKLFPKGVSLLHVRPCLYVNRYMPQGGSDCTLGEI